MKTIHDPRYLRLINLLIEIRKSRAITQVDLAKRLSHSQSYVAKVENFERRLDVLELSDWLSALDWKMEDFFQQLGW